MKLYYIYHVPGIKVGCTSEPQKRLKIQSHSQYQLLEVYEDIIEASNREIEIQKMMGYKVDKVPYYISVERRKLADKKNKENNHSQKLGLIYGKKNVESGLMDSIRHLGLIATYKNINTCPHCKKTIKGPQYYQWHGDKCKHKSN
jgi:hypothetical protein